MTVFSILKSLAFPVAETAISSILRRSEALHAVPLMPFPFKT